MRYLLVIAAFFSLSAGAFAADEAPAVPAETAKEPEAAANLDPTSAVVAEGRFLYRQRDLDALVAIAAREAKVKLNRSDEEQLRACLLQALTAREHLMETLDGLPVSISNKARDALVLDLLDYQAELIPKRTAPSKIISNDPALATPADTNSAAAAPNVKPTEAAANTGTVLVRLPPLTVVRSLEGVGKRQLTLGLALYFPSQDVAKKMEEKAPLIQDAILSFVQSLTATEFAEPNQVVLKEGLVKAIISRVPEFPANGILIPQLDVTAPDPAAGK